MSLKLSLYGQFLFMMLEKNNGSDLSLAKVNFRSPDFRKHILDIIINTIFHSQTRTCWSSVQGIHRFQLMVVDYCRLLLLCHLHSPLELRARIANQFRFKIWLTDKFVPDFLEREAVVFS